MDEQAKQAAVNAKIASHIPDAWSSTVAIVVARRPAVHLLGTGTLFEVGGAHFVVTAGHVAEIALQHNMTMALTDASQSFVAIDGTWVSFETGDAPSSEGAFDIAVHRLSSRSVAKLCGMKFLRREDVDFVEQSATAVFAVFGFPGMWASSSRTDEERLRLKPLEFVSYRYQGDVTSFNGYDPDHHILLGGSKDQLTLADGSPPTFVKKDGSPATLPRDLSGISGCSTWVLGDLRVPVERWSDRPPRVVGIETGIYQSSEVVRATRWLAVTALVYRAFPDLRAALDLWTPARGA